ncbi:MAG TPA: hypothetical protein PKD69_06150, partial [Elusimicrobiota bacterium]|nr:hypothetical protein [Elusimicrobiota bacterium]
RAWTRGGEVRIRDLNGVAQSVGWGETGATRVWWRYRPAPFLWGLAGTLAAVAAGLWALGRRLAVGGGGGGL